MNPLEWVMKGRFGAAARAGAGFLTVSIIGAVGLLAVAIVLWAASLTPFGLWAGLPVIAIGVLVAAWLWRDAMGQAKSEGSTALLEFREPSFWSRGPAPAQDKPTAARLPRVKLTGLPASVIPHVQKPAGVPDADALRRAFDQAFAAGNLDEADRVLTKLAVMAGQSEWARRKQRLVGQQRARS
jgi:hypothetical protein